MNMGVNRCPARCALLSGQWLKEWSQLQCACPRIQITLKITHVYLIVIKTVNSILDSVS